MILDDSRRKLLAEAGGDVYTRRMEISRPPDIESCSTWLEIDLSAIRNNIRLLSQITRTGVMPVVKANAYGHGLIEVSQAAEKEGVSWLGVSRIEEAIALRHAGIRCSILILGFTPPRRIPDAIHYDLAVTLYDEEIAGDYHKEALNNNRILRVHVKTDTGMGRLGVPVKEAFTFLSDLKHYPNLSIEGLFTHFACADEPGASTTKEQMEKFQTLLDQLDRRGPRPRIIHAANSAGALNFPAGRFDMVRCGISIYGLHPSPETILPQGFKKALTWKTRLTSIKTLPPGHGVSYGFHYYTTHEERIGVIAIGYADGFRRIKGNQVLINGRKVDVVGVVCMDQCMVRLDDLASAVVGDEVILIGEQTETNITAEDIAKTWGSINYEVVCGLADRVPRFYKG
jgi:alanine racemase